MIEPKQLKLLLNQAQAKDAIDAFLNEITTNVANGNKELGYTCILSNSNVATLTVAAGGAVDGAGSAFTAVGDDSANSVSAVGTRFDIVAKSVTVDSATTITIVGNETGGTVTIPVTVKKDPEIAIITQGLSQ